MPRFRDIRLLQWVTILFCIVAILFFINSIPNYFETVRTKCVLQTCGSLAPAPPTTLKVLSTYHLTPDSYALWFVVIECIFALVFYTAAFIIFVKSKRDRMGMLAILALVGYGTTFTSLIYMGSEGSTILSYVPPVIAAVGRLALFLFLLLFPNGKFVPKWTYLPFIPFFAVQVISLLLPGTSFDLVNWANGARLFYYLTMIGVTIYSQFFRYRRESTATERQQTKWVVYGAAISFLGSTVISGFFVYPVFADSPLTYVYLSALLYAVVSIIPVTLAIAVLRKRLWDIDPLVNRTLLYVGLSISIILIYSVLVIYLGNLFKTEGNFLISLVSTSIVAILFSPIKERLQKLLNRLLKGRHDDPYSVLRELGDHLTKPLASEEMLQVTAAAIREALRLPYAAIAIGVEGEEDVAAFSGKQAFDILFYPIVHGGEEVGSLLLSSRSPGEAFTLEDQKLLDVLLHQAGPIVQNVKMEIGMRLLANNLQESRERLVLAREEERLHIRRNLHDDLAPKLLSLSFNVAAAEQYVKKSPEKTLELLGELRKVIRSTVDEIRTMVHNLRPPTLDEFGLVGSIRARLEEIKKTSEPLQVSLIAPEKLPVLPAAVEVAAYRIITESLVNVVKHANARHCKVIIKVNSNGELQIEIEDDGIGLPVYVKTSGVNGIGLKSIRERTAELGGQCFFEKSEPCGTRVKAVLPFLQKEGTE